MSGRDFVAIIIAGGVILWGVIAFAGMVWHGHSLSEVGGEALVAIGGSLVGALAAYLARGRLGSGADDGNGKSP